VFNSVVGLAFLAAVARSLDIETFGRYALLTTLLVSISKIIDFGTNSVYVTRYITTKTENLYNQFVSIKFILFLFACPVLLLISYFTGTRNPLLLLILVLGLLAYGINYTLYAIFQREEKYTPLVLLNTLPAIIKGVFALAVFGHFLTLDFGQSISIFSLSVFGSAFLLLFVDKSERNIQLTLTGLKSFFVHAYPGGISQVIYESWPSISNLIAKSIRGFYDVGIFSLASKVSRFFSLVSISIFTVLLPKNAQRKQNSLKYDFKESFIISFLITLTAVLCIPAARILLINVFGAKYTESLTVLELLIFSAALASIHTFLENFFFVENKTHYLTYINMGKLAVFLLLCSYLVPTYALYGLALSDLVASTTAVVGTIIFIKASKVS
jgi:O-antigen/teichoic acid export membrane protein